MKKRDMEIHNLEMETSESHGTFKIPKLKKVNKFKVAEGINTDINLSIHPSSHPFSIMTCYPTM